MHVCRTRGLSPARIDADDFKRRVFRFRVFKATIQNRMRPRRVAACDHDEFSVIQIVVARRRRICAERGLVASHRRRHAQARIGVDVISADQPLRELVEDVVVLGQQLSGNVEANAIGTVLGNAAGEFFDEGVEGNVPAHALAILLAGCPHFGIQRATIGCGRQVQRAAFGTQAAKICRVIGIAANGRDSRAIRTRQHPATHAAIRAGRFDFLNASDHFARLQVAWFESATVTI